MSVTVIGCDPGAKGAICVLTISDDNSPVIQFFDNTNDFNETLSWLDKATRQILTVKMQMIEEVHSLPGMSAKSNFSFGYNLALSTCALKFVGHGLDKVQPKVWQKAIGIISKPKVKRTPAQLKKEVANICKTLYPGCDIYGPKGGLKDGRSDALMIAHYCYLKYK